MMIVDNNIIYNYIYTHTQSELRGLHNERKSTSVFFYYDTYFGIAVEDDGQLAGGDGTTELIAVEVWERGEAYELWWCCWWWYWCNDGWCSIVVVGYECIIGDECTDCCPGEECTKETGEWCCGWIIGTSRR